MTLLPADPARSVADLERDRHDHPAAVLEFLGVKPGHRVLDMNAATGYCTELLSRAVGAEGHVIAHNHPGAEPILGSDAIRARYRDDRLPNVALLVARHEHLKPAPASLDAVLMCMVYHDLYWYRSGVDWGPVEPVAVLKNLRRALKPGGVIGVIDHCADAGDDPASSVMELHRIDPEVVRRDFQRAGFALEAESDLLRNPADDHQRGVFDPAIRGRTDRFLMRFRVAQVMR